MLNISLGHSVFNTMVMHDTFTYIYRKVTVCLVEQVLYFFQACCDYLLLASSCKDTESGQCWHFNGHCVGIGVGGERLRRRSHGKKSKQATSAIFESQVGFSLPLNFGETKSDSQRKGNKEKEK